MKTTIYLALVLVAGLSCAAPVRNTGKMSTCSALETRVAEIEKKLAAAQKALASIGVATDAPVVWETVKTGPTLPEGCRASMNNGFQYYVCPAN